MGRPIRPSEQKAAAAAKHAHKLEQPDSVRLVLELPSETRRKLKVRAAERGQTIKSYLVTLMREDGLDVEA